jgi:hypothetical protein
MILFVIIHQTAQKNKRFARDSADFFRKIVFKKGRGRIWRLRGCAVVGADEIKDEAELKSRERIATSQVPRPAPRNDTCLCGGFPVSAASSFVIQATPPQNPSCNT